MKLHPLLAGLCNAVVPGLGYLILDERKVFGWLLLAGSIACILLSFIEPSFLTLTLFTSTTKGGKFLEGFWYACFTLAYGYDAYSLARAKQQPPLPPAPNVSYEERISEKH